MSNQKPSQQPGGKPQGGKPPKGPSLFPLLKPYRRMIFLLIALALVMVVLNLTIPKIIQHGIDAFIRDRSNVQLFVREFLLAALGVFVFTYGMSYVQTFASERVARDLRTQLSNRISRQNYAFLNQQSPAKLLTN